MPNLINFPYPYAMQAGQGVNQPGGVPGSNMSGCGHMHGPLDALTSSDDPVSDIVNAQRTDARKEGFTQGLIVGAGGAVVATLVLKAVPAVIKIGAVAAAGWYFFGRKEGGRTANSGGSDLPRHIGDTRVIHAHGSTARVKKHSAGSYVMFKDGVTERSRWGDAGQMREDIQHFEQFGTLPGGKASSRW